MKDAFIPLSLLLFIALFIYALIRTARKQRKAKGAVFKGFADKSGLRYLEEDDGTAQEFARGMDGIGHFSSPSLGKVIPKDVVTGTLNGWEATLFRHSTRFSEGWAREWYVAGVTGAETIAKRCSVQFCKTKADKTTMYLQDPVVKEQRIGAFNLVIRAPDPSTAGRILDQDVLNQLAGLASSLSFRPEIQIRGKRLAAYLADRNATVDYLATLDELFEFTERAASVWNQGDRP